MSMNFGIIRFPETTGHEDFAFVLSELFEHEVFEVWHRDLIKKKFDALFIPSGRIDTRGIRTRLKEPVINEIVKFANNGGFILGVGLGFQLLCELELLPGKLAQNENGKFFCENVHIKPNHIQSAITANLNTSMAYKIPIATQWGKYMADDDSVRLMREKQQILFQYCNPDGHLSEQANPTGARANIAAVCNAGKNVYGIIPQPERAVDEELGNTDGAILFDSIFAYLK